jgi:hypothetical protein
MARLPRIVRHRGPLVAAALAGVTAQLLATGASAEVAVYEVIVPVAGVTEADRTAGLAEAVRAVAVKVSGRREAADDARVRATDPSRLVQRYSLSPEKLLKVGFDGPAVEQMLQQAGLPVWPAERPVTLVDAPAVDAAALGLAAAWRGLPVAWSAAGATTPTGPARAVLAGSASGAAIAWTFTHDGRVVTARGGVREGVDLAADTLAARYAPASTRAVSGLSLRIGGVDGLGDYAGLLAYLRALSLVHGVDVEALDGDVLTLRLQLRGDRELLGRIAALEGRLSAPDAAQAAEVDFLYQP